MTEQIKSAISIIENEKECVQSGVFCDRDCANCKLVKEDSEIIGAFDTTIRSLQAWEEVLQELKLVISGCDLMLEDTDNPFYEGKKMGYLKAIDIIKQKLAEIEE